MRKNHENIISATVLSALFMFNAQAADTMDKTHEVKGSMSSAHDKMCKDGMCKNAMDKEKMEKEHMSKTDGMKMTTWVKRQYVSIS